jgi:hypothetical protein
VSRYLVDAAIAPLSETWREAVRHAEDVVAPDGQFRESFAPCCFIRNGAGAEVQLGHDGQVVGHVNVVVASRSQHMHIAELELVGDEELLARVRPGQRVSLDAYSHSSDTDRLAGLRRHELVELRHVAILQDGDIPGYRAARILSVRKMTETPTQARTSGVDWRAVLPAEWATGIDVRNLPADPPSELTDDRRGRTWRWTGERFVAADRIAA